MTYDYATWVMRAHSLRAKGQQIAAGVICPTCLKPIPSFVTGVEGDCNCGPLASIREVEQAHGFPRGLMSETDYCDPSLLKDIS